MKSFTFELLIALYVISCTTFVDGQPKRPPQYFWLSSVSAVSGVYYMNYKTHNTTLLPYMDKDGKTMSWINHGL